MQAVINTGDPYPAGSQSFTMTNPNYQTVISTSGWTSQGTSNGAVSGVVNLVRLPSMQAYASVYGVTNTAWQHLTQQCLTKGVYPAQAVSSCSPHYGCWWWVYQQRCLSGPSEQALSEFMGN